MKKYDLPDLPEGYRWKIVNKDDHPNLGIQKKFFGIWGWVVAPKPVWLRGTLVYPKRDIFDIAIEHTATDMFDKFREQETLDEYFKERNIRRMWW